MTTISKEYLELNKKLHESRQDYGTSGHKWASTILQICKETPIETILDYGCGKQTLAKAAPILNITGYDPAIEGLDKKPEPADLVICTDVMEHIEPEYLDAVLDELKALTKKMLFLVVATRPAVKTLEDGRNAHLIIETYEWWLPKIFDRFGLIQINNMGGNEFIFVGSKKDD